jgi:iron complex outermembrane receptor protein
MLKKTPLASAISSITLASAMIAAGAVFPAYAEDDDAMLEEVIVTGSRIKTSVNNAPRPVSVINRLDIELSGMETVADVLRYSTFNSFGSYSEQSGSASGQSAQVNLRGLGADRTAVLINGRRVPGNPLTGSAAVDLNSIPVGAIERVELLTDSASSVYGADAIGGVVNIIFRKDFEGAEFEIGSEVPSRAGGDSDHVNFTFGAQGERSSVLFSAEWYKVNPVLDAERDYSKVSISPSAASGVPIHSAETEGVSAGGNTGFTPGFTDAFPLSVDGTIATCADGLQPLLAPQFGIVGTTGCGFGYADISMQTGGIDRKSTYLDARYEVTPDAELYLESRYSRSSTFGRYAPAVGFFGITADNTLNPRGHAAAGDVNGNGMLDDGTNISAFHRFIAHGNRDDRYSRDEFDNVFGVAGTIEEINYDVYARYYENRISSEGDTYVLASVLEDLVASGDYNFIDPLSQDPTHLAAVAQSSATLSRDVFTEYTAAGFSLDGTTVEIGGGAIGWAAGAEVASENYQDEYDNFREAMNVLGSAGNSSEGSRSRWAAFGELALPITEDLEINLAGRFDDYEDFGSEFSPSISGRYSPIDQLTIRASWGEGFKAPNLGDIGQELSSSFDQVIDFTFCAAQGISDAKCPDLQIENSTGGNRSLQAEQTESWNIGFLVEPIENLSFSVDFWNIKIEDAVESLTLAEVIAFEQAGTLPPGVLVNRGPAGNITQCTTSVMAPDCGIINVFANLATLEHGGFDIRGEYVWNTDSIGTLRATLEYSQLTTVDQKSTPTSDLLDLVGTEETPEFRYNANLRWNIEAFAVNYVFMYIDGHGGGPIAAGAGNYDDYTRHDFNVTWTAPWGGEISAGARNLTDEEPILDDVSGFNSAISQDLYSVKGRVPYFTYRHFF